MPVQPSVSEPGLLAELRDRAGQVAAEHTHRVWTGGHQQRRSLALPESGLRPAAGTMGGQVFSGGGEA